MACGLDIGSNTFSLAELRPGPAGIEVVQDVSLVARLSEGLKDGGPLSPTAVFRGLEILKTLYTRFDLGQKPLRAVGTAVLRMARDPEVFLEPAKEILGVDVEIVSGEEEALLVSKGASLGLNQEITWVVADVGGQSTEICWQDEKGHFTPISLPIGVVGLTSRFIKSDPPISDEVHALTLQVRKVLSEAVPTDIKGQLLGVAGTATTLGMLDLDLNTWHRKKVHGFEMSDTRLKKWQTRILEATTKERQERYGVRPGRADVFPAGILVLSEILAHLNRDAFTISANGLRVGIALEMMTQA